MDAKAKELAGYLVERFRNLPPQTRLIIGIAGIPASGKSTLANLIVQHTNALLKPSNAESDGRAEEAIVVGLDGWHLTRAQLAAMPDPRLAKDKRGAHWTFDPDGYLEFVRSLRAPLPSTQSHSDLAAIIAPSFDHAVKDPDPTGVNIYPRHRIVVIEGLYCFLSIGAWKEAGEMLDERWLATVEFEEATGRITDRHVTSGVAGSIEEAQWRARENDMPNGQFLLDNSLEPTRTIASVRDPALFSPSANERDTELS